MGINKKNGGCKNPLLKKTKNNIMTREYIEIYDGLDCYEVEAIIGRGYAGSYDRAPEPNTVDIIKIYSTDEDIFVDYNTEDGESLFLYAEQCIEEMLDAGEI